MNKKPTDNQIHQLGAALGEMEALHPSGLSDLPADFHYQQLDDRIGGCYYQWGDEEGTRIAELFSESFMAAYEEAKS